MATSRRALKSAENIPARFAPVAGDAVTLARNVGTQVEFVAVAGATESLLQTQSGAVDIVAGLASDALGCSDEEQRAQGKPGPACTHGPRAKRARARTPY